MKTGPNIVTDGLVLALDGYSNVRGFSKFGTSGTNNSHRAIRNLVNIGGPSSEFTLSNTSQLTGAEYFTLYALRYPESSRTPANRDGITPGFSNTSATKTYDCSRDLNYFVFDETTNEWVANGYFNGERINGHSYDTYDGEPDQHQKFQDDYDVIKEAFPNATHIVIGSHSAGNVDNDTDTVTRLKEIGLPASHTGLGTNEFVLVGKVNKPHTHHYLKNNVDSTVAHMNLRLPLEGLGGSMIFDGTDDYISIDVAADYIAGGDFSLEAVIKGSTQDHKTIIAVNTSGGGNRVLWMVRSAGMGIYDGTNWYIGDEDVDDNNYHHIVLTYDFSSKNAKIYTDNILDTNVTTSNQINVSNSDSVSIGMEYDGGTPSDLFNGEIPIVKVYDKILSAAEVKQNFNAYRKRFGI